MKALLLTAAAVGALGLFGSIASANDWQSSNYHHDLSHREQYRQQIHHNAHQGWMTPWQHSGLHQSLNHSRYHDQVQHRAYDRQIAPSWGFGSRGGVWLGY